MTNLKRTPIYEQVKQLGGKTIDFGGWELPVQFSGIKNEHKAVRENAGLFDVSHMGEIEVTGEGAEIFLNTLLTNDVTTLCPGEAQYSIMCYEDGGTVDDLLVYKKADQAYWLVVNAANIDKDFEWITSHANDAVRIQNRSEDIALLALQGPNAEKIVQKVTHVPIHPIKPFHFVDEVDLSGTPALISRTGYTGEDGFEIYCKWEEAPRLWKVILEAGEEEGLIPCGLGARDTLRFEARLALYSQELSRSISPLEAGLGFAVKLNKESNFIGQHALLKQKEQGSPRKLVGIEMLDKAIPRTHYPVLIGDEQLGEVTTGTQSPTLGKNLGLALIKADYAKPGTEVEIEIRGKRKKAVVVKTPFYKRTGL